MATLRGIIAYLCDNYPHKDELSDGRLTKMVYLADWKAVLERGEQLTDLDWFFHQHGPYLEDIKEVVESSDEFELVDTVNMYGSPKKVIRYLGQSVEDQLEVWEKNILDEVIDKTEDLYWDDFLQFVYSTYPIVTGDQFESLDLKNAAVEYEGSKDLIVKN